MIERRSFRESDLHRVGPPPTPWPAQPGSFVRLRSGSPIGVIVEIYPTGAGWEGRALVSWVGSPRTAWLGGSSCALDPISAKCLDPAVA